MLASSGTVMPEVRLQRRRWSGPVTQFSASTLRRCSSPKISILSVTSVPTVNTKRSAKQFARRHLAGS